MCYNFYNMVNKNRSLVRARRALQKYSNNKRANVNKSFFKTGRGQYSEGDKFCGASVPDTRQVARQFCDLALTDIKKLLNSAIHEERLLGLLILVEQFHGADNTNSCRIYKFYLANLDGVNNWDLVDLSAYRIVGQYLSGRDKAILYKLAKSKNLWHRRIAIISTFTQIRQNDFSNTLKLANILMRDEHDLMHKAVGWMLREVGKRSKSALTRFLDKNNKAMPRTMLRYAIERLTAKERKHYLSGY